MFSNCIMCKVDKALVFPIHTGEHLVYVGPDKDAYPKASHKVVQCTSEAPVASFQNQTYHCTRADKHIGAHSLIDDGDNLRCVWANQ